VGVFKKKTRETVGGEEELDGCALFVRSERFQIVSKYGIEFDDFARQYTVKRRVLRRLVKGNVGLFVVLEDLQSPSGRKRQFVVANVHTYWNPDFADVKLWQTWVLCQELEKLVLSRGLPLVICGDFNSTPDSPVYDLLATSRVQSDDSIFQKDPERLLPAPSALTHALGLRSAYATVLGREPAATNFTDKFVGVLDYIWYSKVHLTPVAVLDVDEQAVLKKYTALPSPLFASDHISLTCFLDWVV